MARTKAKGTVAEEVRGAGPRDPERTSASILAAAVTEFTEKGYAGARIDAIALKSGVNKRMIYHYFGDKDGLYLAVLESAYVGIRELEAKLQLTDLEPVQAIERLIDFTWDYFIEHRSFSACSAPRTCTGRSSSRSRSACFSFIRRWCR